MLLDMDNVLPARGQIFSVFGLLRLPGYALGVFPSLFWRYGLVSSCIPQWGLPVFVF